VDWAGARGVRYWRGQWVRIDAWTTNEALHNYYESGAFNSIRYASLAKTSIVLVRLFQKPTAEIDVESVVRFIEPVDGVASRPDPRG
jgi:hypothetical protein